MHEAAEEQMMPTRKKCRDCRECGHKSRGYSRKYSCREHRQPEPDARALVLIEERLREEYAGEAARAALEMKEADDQRERQRRADEEAACAENARKEETAKDAIERIAPECRDCVDCHEAGFGPRTSMVRLMSAHSCLVMMCRKHSKACREAQELIDEMSAPASQSLAIQY